MQDITEAQAIGLLKKHSRNEVSFTRVLGHVKAVQELALEIAKDIPGVDIEYIRIGSLLHDIGRFDTWPDRVQQHGIVGAEICRKEGIPQYASICERHLGAGISKQDIIDQKLDLPLKEYVPITKEEKIITHADNLIAGSKRITLQQCLDRWEKELGHKVAEKVKALAEEVEGMRKRK
ncbi:MAG TPA: HD domain-containing protein [Candidatus Nanoarchaeia archaeon]|nr:HD domain-containing protein [Candidatus Nanoarchaeia archaeon]